MADLFDQIDLGAIALPNRIVMAPLTRARSNRDGVPNALMAEYYAQRADAGLIISEATGITREGLGWPNAPGLWAKCQVQGWQQVTQAVQGALTETLQDKVEEMVMEKVAEAVQKKAEEVQQQNDHGSAEKKDVL